MMDCSIFRLKFLLSNGSYALKIIIKIEVNMKRTSYIIMHILQLIIYIVLAIVLATLYNTYVYDTWYILLFSYFVIESVLHLVALMINNLDK